MGDETENADDGDFSVQWSRHWPLDSGTTYLNHGAFGAAPKRVLARQDELQEQLERNPVQFFDREYPDLLDRSRAELADFVGADPEGLALAPNATSGVNAVLRSRSFDPGDELLITDQAYPACRHALQFVAERSGAEVRVAEMPYPLGDPGAIVESLVDAASPRTELAILDHVASPTGTVVPVAELVEALEERDVETLVDGAHAPGMVDLDIAEISPTYYAGNCHKWMCAPKGAGFLWVDEHERDGIHPLTISNGYRMETRDRSPFRNEFDWTGTRDPTPWLCVPTAIDHLASLVPDGWSALRNRNRDLVLRARELLCDALDEEPPAPEACVGTMAAIPLPDGPRTRVSGPFDSAPLEEELAREHGIEVPVQRWPGADSAYLRLSAQLYNSFDEYRKLADVLVDEYR